MWVHLIRRRRTWLVAALPLAGWLLVTLARSGRVPASVPVVGAVARRHGAVAAPQPVDALVASAGHRPASSPHARDLAAHNEGVIDAYRRRHAAPGADHAS